MGSLIGVYVLLRAILASRFGRVVVAIRENETRAMLLGYDPRLYKLVTFVISAGVGGLAGCLFTNWGGFISPTVFGLTMSAQVIIFVLVGGLGTLLGPMLGAVGIQYLIILAGTQSVVDSNLGLGVVLVAFVLLVPQGVVPVVRDRRSRQGRSAARSAATRLRRGGGRAGTPHERATPLLSRRAALTMRFGGVTAVQSVDLTLREAELRCLIGPNGAGKSTFFKMLTGQLRPSEGTILLRGQRRHRRQPARDRPARRGHQDAGAQRVQRADRARERVHRGRAGSARCGARAIVAERRWRGWSWSRSRSASWGSSRTGSGSGSRSPRCWRRNPT